MKKDNFSFLHSQKGAALELSIFVLLLLFTFCVLLTTTSLVLQKKNNRLSVYFAEDHAVEQIAEDFIFEVKKANEESVEGEALTEKWNDFRNSITEYEVSVTEADGGFRLEIREKTEKDDENGEGKLLLSYQVNREGRILSRSHNENSEVRGE